MAPPIALASPVAPELPEEELRPFVAPVAAMRVSFSAGPVSPELPRETPLPPELPVESASPPEDESPVGPEPPASPPAVEPDSASGELPAVPLLPPVLPELLPPAPVATGPEPPERAVGTTGTTAAPPTPPAALAMAMEFPPSTVPTAFPPTANVTFVALPPWPELAAAMPPFPPRMLRAADAGVTTDPSGAPGVPLACEGAM